MRASLRSGRAARQAVDQMSMLREAATWPKRNSGAWYPPDSHRQGDTRRGSGARRSEQGLGASWNAGHDMSAVRDSPRGVARWWVAYLL